MPRITIGTTPIQLAWRNPKRKSWELEFIPASIISGNTGIVFVKRGSAPKADILSNTWDHTLSSGDQAGDNLDGAADKSPWEGDIWAVSDAAAQICTFRETNQDEG